MSAIATLADVLPLRPRLDPASSRPVPRVVVKVVSDAVVLDAAAQVVVSYQAGTGKILFTAAGRALMSLNTQTGALICAGPVSTGTP